jgi:hypothetical protein
VRLFPVLALVAPIALAACAAGPGPSPVARSDSAACVDAFRWYDAVSATMSTPGGRDGRMSIPPALQFPVARIQSLGCLTFTDALAPMATAERPPVADSGPAIPPTSIHAGVVTNMADEAEALAFFNAHLNTPGARARSIGAAGLGRRIYLGPFATEGALDQARDLAVAAGFAAPYPVRSF